jgi:DNA repair exonuclease SbcCD ATPase subunit
MQSEQISKQIEWLDEERRKDKTLIATLEDRVLTLEGEKAGLTKQVKDLSGDLARVSVMLARFDHIEEDMAQMKVEFTRSLESIEKLRFDRERDADKNRRADMDPLQKSITDIRKELESLSEIKKNNQLRIEEGYRLGRLIEEVRNEFRASQRGEEDEKRSLKLLEENQRQDSKRIVDLQSEIVAIRKRLDEQRGKVDLFSDNVRKMEMRINETQTAEMERKQAQVAFIEKQSMIQVDRERIWKDWQTGFGEMMQKTQEFDNQLQNLDAMSRTLKRSQTAFEEITQNFERRVNEITEVQRLVEERFRQEWVAFKADDQKRWTNYTIEQEEQIRELNRLLGKHSERLVALDDISQETRDLMHQLIEDINKRLQKFLSISHDMLEDFQKSFTNL